MATPGTSAQTKSGASPLVILPQPVRSVPGSSAKALRSLMVSSCPSTLHFHFTCRAAHCIYALLLLSAYSNIFFFLQSFNRWVFFREFAPATEIRERFWRHNDQRFAVVIANEQKV